MRSRKELWQVMLHFAQTEHSKIRYPGICAWIEECTSITDEEAEALLEEIKSYGRTRKYNYSLEGRKHPIIPHVTLLYLWPIKDIKSRISFMEGRIKRHTPKQRS